ncbi:uncharacterized protein CXorf58 homolog [Amazona ochrocephala]
MARGGTAPQRRQRLQRGARMGLKAPDFAGQEFTPFVVFKIFLSTQGQCSKCGKRTNMKHSTLLVLENVIKKNFYIKGKAREEHGSKQFIRKGTVERQTRRTTQIYSLPCSCTVLLQPTSNLVESPVYFGGRNNYWRRLPLQNLPGTTTIHAIVDYAHSKTLSERLKMELKFLLLRPQHQELWQDQLLAVPKVRTYTKFQLHFACQCFSSPWYLAFLHTCEINISIRKAAQRSLKMLPQFINYVSLGRNTV